MAKSMIPITMPPRLISRNSRGRRRFRRIVLAAAIATVPASSALARRSAPLPSSPAAFLAAAPPSAFLAAPGRPGRKIVHTVATATGDRAADRPLPGGERTRFAAARTGGVEDPESGRDGDCSAPPRLWERRDWVLASSAAAGIVAAAGRPRAVLAAGATATVAAPSSSSSSLCDPSVSTWTSNDGRGRTVYLLGTAHVSSASAELAGRIVREVRPDAVFVELDSKRVSRAMPPQSPASVSSSTSQQASPSLASSSQQTPPPPSSATFGGGTSSETSALVSIPFAVADAGSSSSPPMPKKNAFLNAFDVRSRVVDATSKAVGASVKGMYSKLESEGFKAGDEFAVAVREGLSVGSSIVLGDRDVDVTLRRLAEALGKTDVRKLLSSDSEVEKSMENLLPTNMKKQLDEASNAGGETGGKDIAVDREEFRDFVETIKARENVRSIMTALKSAAPEIYEAMVAERDRYMAGGLDGLGATTTVAVMGMAHLDGVEGALMGRGWKERVSCPVNR